MKNLYIIIIALLINQSCKAQQKQLNTPELISGKYLKNETIGKFLGKWVSADRSYLVTFSTRIQNLRKKDIHINIDVIVVKFEKFIHNKQDIAFKLKDPIILYPSFNTNTYAGEYLDPITNNTIKLIVNYIDKQNIQVSRVSSIIGDERKGSIFPAKMELVYNK